MTDRDICRYLTCDEPTRDADDVGSYSARFCSTRCELKYDHVKADAQDAARGGSDGGHHNEPHPEEVRQ